MRRILGLALALWALVPSAMAATRDDVVAGVARCAAIKDNRMWLDCFYGSAQPMRAELGLQPAPASQQQLVPPAPLGMPAPAIKAAGAPPPQDRPGFFARMLTHKNPDPPEPPTKMTAYKFDAVGHFTASLANGETWTQEIGDTAQARWNRPAGTYTVQILPSSYSYHLMKVGPQQFMVSRN
jgi:hypothetical protein